MTLKEDSRDHLLHYVKNKGLKMKANVSGKKHVSSSKYIIEDDEDLRFGWLLRKSAEFVVSICASQFHESNELEPRFHHITKGCLDKHFLNEDFLYKNFRCIV
ncbi:hypothetical protein AAZV13_18G022700 [Glycine max]